MSTTMDIQCTFEERPPMNTLCIRTHASAKALPQVLSSSFDQLALWLQERDVPLTGMPYVAYRSLDMENLDVEIGFPVAGALSGEGELRPGRLPGGIWAQTLHVGPYDAVGPWYEALSTFITDRGMRIAGPGYEMYFDGPGTAPERLRTLVAFPVEPALSREAAIPAGR